MSTSLIPVLDVICDGKGVMPYLRLPDLRSRFRSSSSEGALWGVFFGSISRPTPGVPTAKKDNRGPGGSLYSTLKSLPLSLSIRTCALQEGSAVSQGLGWSGPEHDGPKTQTRQPMNSFCRLVEHWYDISVSLPTWKLEDRPSRHRV